MISFLLILIPLAITLESERYLGIPVGNIDDEEAHLKADVFVADEHTIGFDNLVHAPKDSSCITVMIGPARLEDGYRQVGPGVLLPYAQMDFSWEELPSVRGRNKRENKKAVGIEEMIDSLTLKNPRWRIRLDKTTAAPNEDASYEIIEYVDVEEETDEKEENQPFLHKVTLPAEKEVTPTATTATTTVTPTRPPPKTTKSFVITTTKPVIVFDKEYSQKLAQQKVLKEFPTPPRIMPLAATKPLTTTMKTTQPSTAFDKDYLSSTDEFLEPILEDMESTTLRAASITPSREVASFIVPPAENEKALFFLTNGAKITDYKWLGLWNDCTRTSTPHIWLADVDPPHEEEIPSLKSTTGANMSAPIRILNCNTILVQKLSFKPDTSKLHSYFFVGTLGQNGQEKRAKAKVVGYDIAEPLEEFSGEDIMLRLPKGIRTFDIDFLSIYNEDTGKTIAKVEVPSYLVPPCNI